MTYKFEDCKFVYNKHVSGYCTIHDSLQSGPSGICQSAITEYQRERWSALNGNYWCPNCGAVGEQYMPLRCTRCGGNLTYQGM